MNLWRLELLMVTCLLWFATTVEAYHPDTHENMSELAAQASLIGRDDKNQLLNNLGLGYLANNKRPIYELFRDGANFEDDFPRSLNHFYDPLRNRDLFGVNVASPDWALEDRTDFGDTQEFSYKDAREFLYKALTEKDEKERRKHFDSTFRTLGHVIHHIQDMAQPQHVRNDDHCDVWPCKLVGLYNRSLYEEYTISATLPFTDANYNKDRPVMFSTPRAFWAGAGRGIADFSNRNFVSAGTNFTGTATNISSNPNYLSPNGIGAVVSSRQITDTDLLGPSQPLTGEIDFIGTPVTDNYPGGSSGFNDRTSSYSLFDADLTAAGAEKTFTLNRFNFDAAHPFLIPKAVAYSAGLIDYFFRGQLEMSLPAEGVYGLVDHSQVNQKNIHGFTTVKMKLKNTTPNIVEGGTSYPQDMANGKLVLVAKFRRNNCYQSDLSGEFNYLTSRTWDNCGIVSNYRTETVEFLVSEPVTDVSMSANPSALPRTFTFTFTDPIPINVTDLYFQVVYRGQLGAEADAVVALTKDIYEPTYFSIYNGTDYVYINGQHYTASEVQNDPALRKIAMDNRLDIRELAFLDLRFYFDSLVVASVPRLNPKSYLRMAYLTDEMWQPFFYWATAVDHKTGGGPSYYYVAEGYGSSKKNQGAAASAVERLRGTYYWLHVYHQETYPFESDLVSLNRLGTIDANPTPVTIYYSP